MSNQFAGERTRRRYERVTGPFDGLLAEKPVLLYDLNLGGCFVNSPVESPAGAVQVLKIDLMEEGWITVSAETLHALQHGYGVQFVELDSDSAARIKRTVEARMNRWR